MRTLIKFKLKTKLSSLLSYLPKTLSAELDNFSMLLGKYRVVGGKQSIWRCKNGQIELADQYSFNYHNWFSANITNPLREMVDQRREERGPFLVKIAPESCIHGRIAILVSKSNCSHYETEHLVEMKDRAVWAWSKNKVFKQEFFSDNRLMIIFWDINTENRWHGIYSASEFYFENGCFIWKKYHCLNRLFYTITEYEMERIGCKFDKFNV